MSTRKLSGSPLALIQSVIERLPEPDRSAMVAQVQSAVVTAEVQGRSIDLDVGLRVPRSSLPDGPIRPVPAVLGRDGQLVGELILWVRSGYLIGLERPWFGDEPPTAWPEAEDLDFT